MPNDTAAEADVLLASFPRRNRATGGLESTRIIARDWNGRVYVHVRRFYQSKKATAGNDGFSPGKDGDHFVEDELDDVIEALERAREIVRAEGRSTSRHPVTAAARTQAKPPRRRPERAATPVHQSRSTTPWESSEADDFKLEGEPAEEFDEFAEFRRNPR